MCKILAIDDQNDNLITLKAVIKSQKPECEVFLSDTGLKGYELAKKELPDIIILDIIMPEVDGYEVCKILKNDETTKHIPVLMLTAIRTDSESRIKGLEIGADAFLSKPIDSVEFTAQVNVLLRIKRAEDKLRLEKKVLEEKNKKLIWYNKLFESREFRIKELRDKVKELEERLGIQKGN